MNWFPERISDTKLILESNSDLKERFILIPKSDVNASTAFISFDLYETCLKNNYTPIILPSINEYFITHFCSLIWNVFKKETAIIDQFLQNQPTFRALGLRRHISNSNDNTPDIGLYDALQLLKIPKTKIVLLSENIDVLFDKKYRYLLTALNGFVKDAPTSLLIGVGGAEIINCSKRFRKYGYKIYELNDMTGTEVVSHGLGVVKRVSPHLNISVLEAIEYYSICHCVEDFILKLQEMVLYQRQDFK